MDRDAQPADDLPTVAALGVLAYVSADLAHHLLGHAAACAELGGRLLSLSAIYVRCTVTGASIDLAGPAANLGVGLASWGAALALGKRPMWTLALLLAAAFNLFWFEAQLIFSAAAGRDDWNELIRALHPALAWRAFFICAGAASYALTVRGLGVSLSGFAGPQSDRLSRIARTAYAAAGLTTCLTGLRDPGGLAALLSKAAPQALVLSAGLLFLNAAARPNGEARIEQNVPLIALAVVAVGLSILYLGPGVMFHAGR